MVRIWVDGRSEGPVRASAVLVFAREPGCCQASCVLARLGCVATGCLMLMLLWAGWASATVIGPLVWSTPIPTDHAAFRGGSSFTAISCSSVLFCGAIDSAGLIFTSANPVAGAESWRSGRTPGELAGVSCPAVSLCLIGEHEFVSASSNPTGGAGTWTREVMFPSSGGPISNIGNTNASGISCVSAFLCIASGIGNVCNGRCVPSYTGYLEISNDPLGGPGAWQEVKLPNAGLLTDASCASSSLCVAVSANGNIVSSASPFGGASRWAISAPADHAGAGFSRVSCVPPGLCAAVNGTGAVFASSNPASGAGSWREISLDSLQLTGIACASASLCVAAGGHEAFVSTDPVAGPSAWRAVVIDPSASVTDVSCPSPTLCVAVDSAGNTIIGTPPTAIEVASSLASEIAPKAAITAASLLRSGGYRLPFTPPLPGTVRVDWRVIQARRGHSTHVLIATMTHTFSSLAPSILPVRLTAPDHALLKGTKRLKVTATATLATTGRPSIKALSSFQITG